MSSSSMVCSSFCSHEMVSASLRPGPAHIQLWGQMCQLYMQVTMWSGLDAMSDSCGQFPTSLVGSCLFFQIPSCLCVHPCHAQIFILSGSPAYISWLQPPPDTDATVFHSCHYQLPQVSQFCKSFISFIVALCACLNPNWYTIGLLFSQIVIFFCICN